MTFSRLFSFITMLMLSNFACSSNDISLSNITKPQGKILFGSKDTTGDNSKLYIYMMNADGTKQRLSIYNDKLIDELMISPDSKLVVFTSAKQLYVMNIDGTGKHKIADNGEAPVWSPDSKSIAFQSFQSGNWEIYTINADGTHLNNITNSPRTETFPSWSPDGKSIIFHTTRAGKNDTYNTNWEIYKINPDGTNPLRLTFTQALNWFPVWSPDGKTIAFWSNRDGKWNLYVMDNDGRNQHPLTTNGASGNTLTSPTWSPDGKFIAFMSSQPNGWEIREINIKDKNIIKIFTNHKFNGVLQWIK